MLRPLVALSLLTATPAVPQTIEQQSPVPKVVCRVANGYIMGSAFRVGPQYLLTVGHVIGSGQCQIDGQPIKVLYKSTKADFAILADPRAGKVIPVDCGGFKADHDYVAVSHARGLDRLTYIPMTGTGEHYSDIRSLSILAGILTAQPGQSGGPIIDPDTMRVVGTVNTGDWDRGLTGSVALRDTPICGSNIA